MKWYHNDQYWICESNNFIAELFETTAMLKRKDTGELVTFFDDWKNNKLTRQQFCELIMTTIVEKEHEISMDKI